MPRCPFCNSPVGDEELRCPECRADLQPDAEVARELQGDQTDNDHISQPVDEPPPAERIAQLLLEGQRLRAVREWQQATGCDLVEAVESVDRIADKAGIPRPAGCAGLLMAVVLTLLVPAVLVLQTFTGGVRWF